MEKTNHINLEKDTSADAVLIANRFWYFGKNAVEVPKHLVGLIPDCRNYFRPSTEEKLLTDWLESLNEQGFIGEPAKFSEEFERYDGKS